MSHGCCIPRLVGCVSINFDSMNKKWRCKSVRSCLFALASLFSYCWWKQSCTTWNVWNPLNTGINYQPQLVSLFVLFGPFHRLIQRSYLVPCMVRGLKRLWSTNKWRNKWILAMVKIPPFIPEGIFRLEDKGVIQPWKEDKEGILQGTNDIMYILVQKYAE